MTSKIPTEFLHLDGPGRRFVTKRHVRLGDVDPSDQLRFDAIGRYAQDLANDDALDAGLQESLNFVVRKTVIAIDTPPSFREPLTCTTFCNGVGGRWAGRQSVFRGGHGALVTMSAVWVHVDTETGRPKKLSDGFHETFDESAQGQKASIKLLHDPTVTDDAESMPWPFRWADLDLLGHVNNAAYWRPIEQLIRQHRLSRQSMTAELEYRSPTPPDTMATLRSQLGTVPGGSEDSDTAELRVWIVDEASATTLATARITFPNNP